MRFHTLTVAALVAVCVALAGGCAKESRDTPEACMKAFDRYMLGAQTHKASTLFALSKWGEDNSTDWSTYAPSQRDLIVKSLRSEKAGQLGAMQERYAKAGYKITSLQVTGEWASLTLAGAGDPIPVRLYKEKSGWGIYSFGSL